MTAVKDANHTDVVMLPHRLLLTSRRNLCRISMQSRITFHS